MAEMEFFDNISKMKRLIDDCMKHKQTQNKKQEKEEEKDTDIEKFEIKFQKFVLFNNQDYDNKKKIALELTNRRENIINNTIFKLKRQKVH